MKPGDVVLLQLPQMAGGPPKLRPALVLARLPGPYQNVLLCGISTQLRELQPDWDELIDSRDVDYASSGLHRPSAIRLSYLFSTDAKELSGRIGSISPARMNRVLERLSKYLGPK
ncbi:MAG: type II toxin-antitoxin system PemK/MazF family toxin [Pirellulales bacterium]|nr:type II toxin-antitoxin system PemK/MazF family toxin [Pirellulales bacterium]